MKITIRKALPTDHPFIFATYLRNRWFDKGQKTTLKRSTWSSLQHRRIEQVLTLGSVYVACLAEDPDTILGYSFIDSGVPFAYVKLDWRSPGLAIAEKLI